MDDDHAEAVALHRWAVIAEAASDRLEPGRTRRAGARHRRTSPHPSRRHGAPLQRGPPSTAGSGPGAAAVSRPCAPRRAPTPGRCAPTPSSPTRPPRCASSCRAARPPRSPGSSSHRHGIRVAERTVRAPAAPPGPAPRGAGRRAQGLRPLRGRRGRTSAGSPTCWSDRSSRHPRVDLLGAGQAVLDRRRPLAALGRRPLLRARERPGLPGAAAPRPSCVGACPRSSTPTTGRPFKNAWLTRTCAVLGHPPGALRALLARRPGQAGAAEPLHPRGVPRTRRTHQGIESLAELERPLRCLGRAGRQPPHPRRDRARRPIERFERGGPHRQADPERLAEAFRWSVTRKVTRTATVLARGQHLRGRPRPRRPARRAAL